MAFQDISDPYAVRLAVAEFERLGADRFLAKYGFNRSRAYFLAVDGKEYDSKAVVGAAHGYQFPEIGPLRPSDFSGGESTVVQKLKTLGFSVRRKSAAAQQSASGGNEDNVRHPDWNQDELILALDAYVKWNGSPPAKTSEGIAELSKLMNRLRHLLGTPAQMTLRNSNGVYMKLMNFRRFDPAFISQGKSGLSRGNRLEEGVWREFHGDPVRLAHVAETIRAAINGDGNQFRGLPDTIDESMDGVEAVEGRIITAMHRTRERSRRLVDLRKKEAIHKTGTLSCEVCSFNFLARYGERGQDFIECHHTKPVWTLGDGTPTRLVDLALLCSNCHRMIHARRPWLSVEGLKACLQVSAEAIDRLRL
jgi:5-methylcytosine-specific restriction protein A